MGEGEGRRWRRLRKPDLCTLGLVPSRDRVYREQGRHRSCIQGRLRICKVLFPDLLPLFNILDFIFIPYIILVVILLDI